MMRRRRQRATESAVAYLLGMSLIHIRVEVTPLDREPDNGERTLRAWMLADLCHNLPHSLSPEGRHRILDTVEILWQTNSGERLAWIRRCFDEAGYDYSWLAKPTPPGEAAGNPAQVQQPSTATRPPDSP